MNNKQKYVLYGYSVVLILMMLLPPYTLMLQGHVVLNEYSWIWRPVMLSGEYGKTALGVINTVQLSFQVLISTLIASALYFSQRETKV